MNRRNFLAVSSSCAFFGVTGCVNDGRPVDSDEATSENEYTCAREIWSVGLCNELDNSKSNNIKIPNNE